jgi:hypothetical protein
MIVNIQKLLVSTQVQISQWLTHCFSDSYDVLRYDSYIHQLLSAENLSYQTYTTVPWLNYCNPTSESWTVFILQQKEWISVKLPNPFHQADQSCFEVTLNAEVI